MLLTVSFCYLTLTSPYAAYSLIYSWPAADARGRSAEFLVKTIFFAMMYLNHSINFALYCITGRKFRRELVDLLNVCRRSNLGTGSSVKTMRSNCVEMEPLNNESQRLHQRQQQQQLVARFYVARDSVAVADGTSPTRDESSDEDGNCVNSVQDNSQQYPEYNC